MSGTWRPSNTFLINWWPWDVWGFDLNHYPSPALLIPCLNPDISQEQSSHAVTRHDATPKTTLFRSIPPFPKEGAKDKADEIILCVSMLTSAQYSHAVFPSNACYFGRTNDFSIRAAWGTRYQLLPRCSICWLPVRVCYQYCLSYQCDKGNIFPIWHVSILIWASAQLKKFKLAQGYVRLW